MSFSAANMAVFSDRQKNWAKSLQDLVDELERLDQIYIHETASGADANFDDTANANRQEHIDLIVFMRQLRDFVHGTGDPLDVGDLAVDRRPNVTPFLQ